jgi:hypothetical protein
MALSFAHRAWPGAGRLRSIIKYIKRQLAVNKALERTSLVCMPKGGILEPSLSVER